MEMFIAIFCIVVATLALVFFIGEGNNVAKALNLTAAIVFTVLAIAVLRGL